MAWFIDLEEQEKENKECARCGKTIVEGSEAITESMLTETGRHVDYYHVACKRYVPGERKQEFEATYEGMDVKVVISLKIQSIYGIKDCGTYREIFAGKKSFTVKETVNEIKEKISKAEYLAYGHKKLF